MAGAAVNHKGADSNLDGLSAQCEYAEPENRESARDVCHRVRHDIVMSEQIVHSIRPNPHECYADQGYDRPHDPSHDERFAFAPSRRATVTEGTNERLNECA